MLLNPLNRRIRERRGFPVLPGAFPILGHMPAIATDLPALLRRAERDLGPYFWVELGFWGPQLVCTLPAALDLLKNKVTTSTIMHDRAPEFVGGTIIAQDGETHRQRRNAMNRPFQPPGLTVADIGSVFAERIEKAMKAWRAQGEIRLMQETRELAFDLMFLMLGVEETELSLWRQKYDEYLLLSFAVPLNLPGMPGPRGRRARDWIDARFSSFAREARARPESFGILAQLTRSFDESEGALSDHDLAANLRLLLLGGNGTGAAVMASIVVKLAERPDVWNAVCAEATQVGSLPRSPKDLSLFPYTEAVFRETLRFCPPAAIVVRRALADFELGGRQVPSGTNLMLPILHLSRDPGTYERPDEFLPERWLGRKESIKPIEMVQFGGGPHLCLGYHLAWMEIVQFVVALALTMGADGLRPRLIGRHPKPLYVPVSRPRAAVRVGFL